MKALSLFSGIGGIDLAAQWTGIETVAFCEREPFCQKILAKHWPNIPIYDDVCTLTKERLIKDGIGTIDIIFGGYPCQPFSLAGERKGEDDDRHLWPEYFRLVKEIRPRWVVGENVAGHITMGVDRVLVDLENEEYAPRTIVLPACSVNAPHRRDRVFIVGNAQQVGRNGQPRRWSKQEFEDRYIQLEKRIVSNTTSFGQQGQRESIKPIHSTEDQEGETSKSVHVRIRDQWAAEPELGRVANGVPNRVDRLAALGNAVVPQQIYPILAAIKQIDDMLHAV